MIMYIITALVAVYLVYGLVSIYKSTCMCGKPMSDVKMSYDVKEDLGIDDDDYWDRTNEVHYTPAVAASEALKARNKKGKKKTRK